MISLGKDSEVLLGGGGGAGKASQGVTFNHGTAVEIPIDLDYRTHPTISVSMWVRLGDKPRRGANQILISTGVGHGPRIELARNRIVASAGGRRLGPSRVLTPGEWHYVAVSWDHAEGNMNVTVDNTHAFYPLGYEAKSSQKRYTSTHDPDFEKYGRNGAQKRYLWIGAKDGFGKVYSLDDVSINDVRVYKGLLGASQLVELSGGMTNGTYMPEGFRGWPSKWQPQIGNSVDEVGALPELFGDPDLPPDIGVEEPKTDVIDAKAMVPPPGD